MSASDASSSTSDSFARLSPFVYQDAYVEAKEQLDYVNHLLHLNANQVVLTSEEEESRSMSRFVMTKIIETFVTHVFRPEHDKREETIKRLKSKTDRFIEYLASFRTDNHAPSAYMMFYKLCVCMTKLSLDEVENTTLFEIYNSYEPETYQVIGRQESDHQREYKVSEMTQIAEAEYTDIDNFIKDYAYEQELHSIDTPDKSNLKEQDKDLFNDHVSKQVRNYYAATKNLDELLCKGNPHVCGSHLYDQTIIEYKYYIFSKETLDYKKRVIELKRLIDLCDKDISKIDREYARKFRKADVEKKKDNVLQKKRLYESELKKLQSKLSSDSDRKGHFVYSRHYSYDVLILYKLMIRHAYLHLLRINTTLDTDNGVKQLSYMSDKTRTNSKAYCSFYGYNLKNMAQLAINNKVGIGEYRFDEYVLDIAVCGVYINHVDQYLGEENKWDVKSNQNSFLSNGFRMFDASLRTIVDQYVISNLGNIGYNIHVIENEFYIPPIIDNEEDKPITVGQAVDIAQKVLDDKDDGMARLKSIKENDVIQKVWNKPLSSIFLLKEMFNNYTDTNFPPWSRLTKKQHPVKLLRSMLQGKISSTEPHANEMMTYIKKLLPFDLKTDEFTYPVTVLTPTEGDPNLYTYNSDFVSLSKEDKTYRLTIDKPKISVKSGDPGIMSISKANLAEESSMKRIASSVQYSMWSMYNDVTFLTFGGSGTGKTSVLFGKKSSESQLKGLFHYIFDTIPINLPFSSTDATCKSSVTLFEVIPGDENTPRYIHFDGMYDLKTVINEFTTLSNQNKLNEFYQKITYSTDRSYLSYDFVDATERQEFVNKMKTLDDIIKYWRFNIRDPPTIEKTDNNPESSRSMLSYYIELSWGEFVRSLSVIDLPGYERLNQRSIVSSQDIRDMIINQIHELRNKDTMMFNNVFIPLVVINNGGANRIKLRYLESALPIYSIDKIGKTLEYPYYYVNGEKKNIRELFNDIYFLKSIMLEQYYDIQMDQLIPLINLVSPEKINK